MKQKKTSFSVDWVCSVDWSFTGLTILQGDVFQESKKYVINDCKLTYSMLLDHSMLHF